ncbi:MAG: transposase, partial [Opitutales bacterium]
RREYFDLFSAKLEEWLDAGYGSCALKDSECKRIVEEALRHFDGQRYQLGTFVVAANHVHAIVTPKEGHELSDILHSWKSFTATKLNQHLGKSGPFWQKESYDHILRTPAAAARIETYIHEHNSRSGFYC